MIYALKSPDPPNARVTPVDQLLLAEAYAQMGVSPNPYQRIGSLLTHSQVEHRFQHELKLQLGEGLTTPVVQKQVPEHELNIKEEGAQPQKTEPCAPEAETSGTTTFAEDALCERQVALLPLKMPKELGLKQNYSSNYLEKFLARPVLLRSGTLAATDDAATFTQVNHPQEPMALPLYLEKLKGFTYFRAKGVFTLRVNASKFHQGVYKLGCIPTGGFPTSFSGEWINMHYLTTFQRSQLPGPVIDIATTTAVKLEVPYVSSYSSVGYSLAANELHNFAVIRLFPLSPLAFGVGQDSTVGYTIWFHWEDVEIDMPAFPQMADMASEKEGKAHSAGPVESVLDTVNRVSVALTKVPVLSSVAAQAAWASNIGRNIASVMGWSKPQNSSGAGYMIHDVMLNSTNFNGLDNSRNIGIDNTATVEVLPGFGGTDIDELNTDVFLTRPTQLLKFNWLTTAAVGAILATYTISPQMSVAATYDGLVGTNHTPMSFLSTYFEYYRGDIVISLHFVKTEMHSGRIAVYFQPFFDAPGAAISLANSSYCLREIHDLRESNMITVRLPFNSNTVYRRLHDGKTPFGTLTVTVVSELVAPTTCSQSVDIIPWVSAAPGMEFAGPKRCTNFPVTSLPIVATPQSSYIGERPVVDMDNNEESRKCIGEKITSLRQILRVARTCMTAPGLTIPAGVTVIHPYMFPTLRRTGGASTYPTFGGDFLSALSVCYAFSRGGTRLKLFRKGGFNDSYFVLCLDGTSFTDFVTTGGLTYPNTALAGDTSQAIINANFIYTDTAMRGGAEILVPSYSHVPARPGSGCLSVPTISANPSYSMPGQSVSFTSVANETFMLSRCGADDYDLAGFVSIPFMRAHA